MSRRHKIARTAENADASDAFETNGYYSIIRTITLWQENLKKIQNSISLSAHFAYAQLTRSDCIRRSSIVSILLPKFSNSVLKTRIYREETVCFCDTLFKIVNNAHSNDLTMIKYT